jgi:hypothetical protein
MSYKTTKMAAKVLGLTIGQMQRAMWLERFELPQKVGNSYLWTDEDINRASMAILGKPYEPAEAQVAGVA